MIDDRGSGLVALLDRFRAGDPRAAGEIVGAYEPHLRRIIRLRIRDSRLRRLYDSADICQSVLASFFARLSLGQFDLENPAQLVRLLEAMARNKLATEARRSGVARRVEVGAVAGAADGTGPLDRPVPGPSDTERVAWREMAEVVRDRLSDDERAISDLRAAGCEWADIASRIGGGPDAARKRLERAFDRVARELGWEG
ncbi:ECF sigma factor [Aquisphaera giovannonii]|uniref:ECF sigma factor n=1 Tax=Aquisphaera giovannonii TaxID=406548 RepID=A0A5B9W485_9BACT|nr:ECF-type sigma factor [Aquisphaera giovannonii]QEH35412.1 ECF sigma factor [Aquisphaera giovannonii]